MCTRPGPKRGGGGKAHLVRVGAEAEVLDSLARVLGATEQEGVGTSGLLESELVEGDDLAAGIGDARTGGGGDAEGGNRHLGDGQETVVIGDGADDDNGLLLVAVLEVGRDAGQRDGGAVDAAHEQAAQDHLVEGSISAAWKGDVYVRSAAFNRKSAVSEDLRARKR